MSISKEVIEAAQRAMMWKKLPFGGRDLEISLDANAAYAAAELALTAAVPAIQAAALRDAALELCTYVCADNYAPDHCETCRAAEMLRARADQLEGKSE